jgi:hypothetical protein
MPHVISQPHTDAEHGEAEPQTNIKGVEFTREGRGERRQTASLLGTIRA